VYNPAGNSGAGTYGYSPMLGGGGFPLPMGVTPSDSSGASQSPGSPAAGAVAVPLPQGGSVMGQVVAVIQGGALGGGTQTNYTYSGPPPGFKLGPDGRTYVPA
jgi:hypothetical protein